MYTFIPVNRNAFYISKCQKGAIVPPLPYVSATVFMSHLVQDLLRVLLLSLSQTIIFMLQALHVYFFSIMYIDNMILSVYNQSISGGLAVMSQALVSPGPGHSIWEVLG